MERKGKYADLGKGKDFMLLQVPVKALEAVEAGGKIAVFQIHVNYFLFLAKQNFLNDFFTTTLYLLDFIGFYLHLVYVIMQIYPVTRECDEADWLDPFLPELT